MEDFFQAGKYMIFTRSMHARDLLFAKRLHPVYALLDRTALNVVPYRMELHLHYGYAKNEMSRGAIMSFEDVNTLEALQTQLGVSAPRTGIDKIITGYVRSPHGPKEELIAISRRITETEFESLKESFWKRR